jgi:hypothetical protein
LSTCATMKVCVAGSIRSANTNTLLMQIPSWLYVSLIHRVSDVILGS